MNKLPEEEEIYKHDRDLYYAIKPFVSSIPDFRPQETIRMMRGTYVDEEFIPEPQRNWRLVRDELVAIGYNADHMDILEGINQDEIIVKNKEILSDFLLSYPALVWLLFHTGHEYTILALLILHGVKGLPSYYLDLLRTIETLDLVKYIEDKDTAKFIYDILPMSISPTSFNFWFKRGMLPYILFAIQDPSLHLFPKYLDVAVKNNYYDITKALLEDGRINPKNSDALVIAVSLGLPEILSSLLEDKRVDPRDYNGKLLEYAILSGRVNIVRILLEDGRINPKDSNALAIAVDRDLPHILSFLLEDKRIDPRDDLLESAVMDRSANIVRVLLEDGRIDPTARNNHILHVAFRKGYSFTIKILLSDERVKRTVDHDIFMAAIAYGDSEIVRMLLDNPRIDPGENDNDALGAAIYYYDRIIVEDLLNDPRIIVTEGDISHAQDMKDDTRDASYIASMVEKAFEKQRDRL